MLQRLPMKLAQVKAGKTSENLLKKVRQITCSLYLWKEIDKKNMQKCKEFNKDIMQNGYNIHEFKKYQNFWSSEYYLIFLIKLT